jgi:hypothetical protein
MSWKIRMITEKAAGNGTIQGYTPSQAVVTVKNVHCHKNSDLNSWIAIIPWNKVLENLLHYFCFSIFVDVQFPIFVCMF